MLGSLSGLRCSIVGLALSIPKPHFQLMLEPGVLQGGEGSGVSGVSDVTNVRRAVAFGDHRDTNPRTGR